MVALINTFMRAFSHLLLCMYTRCLRHLNVFHYKDAVFVIYTTVVVYLDAFSK